MTTSKRRFAIFIGKFSKCFHLAHQSIVDKIREDGLEPILLIGSAQYYNTKSCPLKVQDRITMIKLVNPNIRMFTIEDKDCWVEWHESLVNIITSEVTPNLDEVTIYTHNKPEDIHSHFNFKGKDYYNDYYSKIFEVEGLHCTNLNLSGIPIRGTDVHNNLEGNKHYLDELVYTFLKDLND